MNEAVGLVEVKGLAAAINVADTMVKVANVKLLGVEKAKGYGWTTIKVLGDVGAVKASVDAGKSNSIESNSYVSSLVIPRPATNLDKLFFNTEAENKEKAEVVEKTVVEVPQKNEAPQQKEIPEKEKKDNKKKPSKKKMKNPEEEK